MSRPPRHAWPIVFHHLAPDMLEPAPLIIEPENQRNPPPPREPAPWPFDEPKLRRLIEQAAQGDVLRRDLAERLREARLALQRLRAAIVQAETGHFGRANPDMYRRRELAEAEVNRLAAEQEAADARIGPSLTVARECRRWAEAQGWTLDGRTGTASLPPAVLDAEGP